MRLLNKAPNPSWRRGDHDVRWEWMIIIFLAPLILYIKFCCNRFYFFRRTGQQRMDSTNMPGISIEFVLADLPSKSSAFTQIKHESRQVDARPTTYIPCHDTSPPMHQVIRESSDEAMLYYVQRMKIDSKVCYAITHTRNSLSFSNTYANRVRQSNTVNPFHHKSAHIQVRLQTQKGRRRKLTVESVGVLSNDTSFLITIFR